MSSLHGNVKTFSLLFLSTTILLVAIWFNGCALYASLRDHGRGPSAHTYTYREFDFPPTLIPMSSHRYDSRMIIEDTAHYAPDASDSAEWHSLFPSGSDGFVRLGPHSRLFGVSMFHQLHCLMKMQRAVFDQPKNSFERYHASHCFNYIRTAILCSSNMRLEPFRPDADSGYDKVDGIGLEHTCRDWSALRDVVEDNYKTWPESLVK